MLGASFSTATPCSRLPCHSLGHAFLQACDLGVVERRDAAGRHGVGHALQSRIAGTASARSVCPSLASTVQPMPPRKLTHFLLVGLHAVLQQSGFTSQKVLRAAQAGGGRGRGRGGGRGGGLGGFGGGGLGGLGGGGRGGGGFGGRGRGGGDFFGFGEGGGRGEGGLGGFGGLGRGGGRGRGGGLGLGGVGGRGGFGRGGFGEGGAAYEAPTMI